MEKSKYSSRELKDSRTRHGRQGENKVKEVLNGLLSKGDALLNGLVLKRTDGYYHQIDHVLLKSNGLFCIETKNYAGNIYGKYDDSRWVIHNPYTRNVSNIMNPLRQNYSHLLAIKEVVNNDSYYFDGIVVFTRGELNVLADGVLKIDSLASYINNKKIYPLYTPNDIKYIYEILHTHDLSDKISSEELVNKAKEKINKIKASMTCPRCGAPLVIKAGRRGPFYSCSRYPKCNFSMDLDEDNTYKKR